MRSDRSWIGAYGMSLVNQHANRSKRGGDMGVAEQLARWWGRNHRVPSLNVIFQGLQPWQCPRHIIQDDVPGVHTDIIGGGV